MIIDLVVRQKEVPNCPAVLVTVFYQTGIQSLFNAPKNQCRLDPLHFVTGPAGIQL